MIQHRPTPPARALRALCLCVLALSVAAPAAFAAPTGGERITTPAEKDFLERYDTLYNSLTVEKRGTVVELRARSRRGDHIESAVDLADPLRLVVAYTRTLYAAHFFQPKPERVLMIGLGGAGFHRLFTVAYPTALLQSVELDPKVFELTRTRLAFQPTERTPVALADGRLFVKRDKTQWDWLILDAFRGGFVPPHLKTKEFYRECAARLTPRGVFVTNLHEGTELFYADLRTLSEVFTQVELFRSAGTGNVIACAVTYAKPSINDPAAWADPANPGNTVPAPNFRGYVDLASLRAERIDWPEARVKRARVLTDDFSPVEFLDAMKAGNTTEPR